MSYVSNLSSLNSPEIWQETMGVLQDQCPEEDFETIKNIVSKELDFDAVFASFEEKPIGAASIGQGRPHIFKNKYSGKRAFTLFVSCNITFCYHFSRSSPGSPQNGTR